MPRLPPYGFLATMHEHDPRVGGHFRMSFTNFGTGSSHAFGGRFLQMVPGVRLVYTDRFDDPGLPGAMRVTVRFEAASCGTALHVTQEGIPAAIPPEMRHLGWQESLARLSLLVEPEIPG
jgi:uncharacterized protein YndB with AHSA1/START domain